MILCLCRRRFHRLVFLFLFVILAATSMARAADDVHILRLASIYQKHHPTTLDTILPWAAGLEARSGGRLQIIFHNPGVLYPEEDVFEGLRNGDVDIGMGVTALSGSRLPLHTVSGLPMLAASAESVSRIAWELHATFPELREEAKDVKILWLWNSPPAMLHTVKRAHILTLDDMAKLPVNCWVETGNRLLSLLGAAPVPTSTNQAYFTLQRGKAEGLLAPFPPLRSLSLQKILASTTEMPLFSTPFWCAMSQAAWDRLPTDLQALIEDSAGRKMSLAMGRSLDRGAGKERAALLAAGHTFIQVSPDERRRFEAAMRPYRKMWINEQEARGCACAGKLVKAAEELGKRYAAGGLAPDNAGALPEDADVERRKPALVPR